MSVSSSDSSSSSSSSDSSEDSSYSSIQLASEVSELSGFSKETVNGYIKAGKEYYALNLMIQMEFCTEKTLEEYLQARAMVDRKFNLNVFSQLVNGLAEIHKRHVLHRDLKPENMFMS
jgi:serine/threonine protein kinase